jgi:membrane protease YdiL (CAAX protease family)
MNGPKVTAAPLCEGSLAVAPAPSEWAKLSAASWVGLFISLFGLLFLRWIFSYIFQETTITSTLLKEVGTWLMAGALLLIVRRGEKLHWISLGIGTARWWESILWAVIIAIASLAAAGLVAHFTGYGQGHDTSPMSRLPLWLLSLIVLRAGVVEELFYRGYAIERLQLLGLGRVQAAAIPLVIFGLAHANRGLAGVVMAIVLGGVLALFYLWRRDLVANMAAHSLVDVVGVILPRVLA